ALSDIGRFPRGGSCPDRMDVAARLLREQHKEIDRLNSVIAGLHNSIAHEQQATQDAKAEVRRLEQVMSKLNSDLIQAGDELIEAEEELDRCVTANMEMRETLDEMTGRVRDHGYLVQ